MNWQMFLLKVLKVSLSHQMWHLVLQVLLSSLMVLSFLFSIRITVVIAAIWWQFWTSSVHAFTQIKISKLFVLGTSTSMPELPSLLKKCTSLIDTFFLPGLILLSCCPPTFNTGWFVSFSAGCSFMQALSSVVSVALSTTAFCCLLIRKWQEVSLCRRSLAVCMPNILPPLSKHNLRNCQLHNVETEWRSPRLLE